MRPFGLAAMFVGIAVAGPATAAAPLTVDMHKINDHGVGEAIGTVTITGTSAGAVFAPDLSGLPQGQHGFHVHENAACGPGPDRFGATIKDRAAFRKLQRRKTEPLPIAAGMAAGGHWDPGHTRMHLGPRGEGHLGDLPMLAVGRDGKADRTVVATRIKDVGEVKGHALVIDDRGDNYSDFPKVNGGGGGHIACGILR